MNWMKREILTGFQALACLSLERQPAREVMPGTVQVWVAAMTLGRKWDERRDTARIRHGFAALCASSRQWPHPRDLLAALPQVERQKALPTTPADPARAAAAISEIASLLANRRPIQRG